MAGEWRASTWGQEVSLEYGKALRGHDQSSGPYRVFGSNGPIGWTNEPLAPGPGVILGRKGAYRGIEYSRDPFFVIDTAYYVVTKRDHDMRWLYYAMKHYRLGEIDDGSPIPSTTRAAVYPREFDVPPLPEQRAIAHILGALDDKIELNRRMSTTLEAMARTIFKESLDQDSKEHRLDDLCEIFDGPHATPKTVPQGPIFLGISNLSNGLLDLSNTRHISEDNFVRWTRRVTPSSGDVVFSYETRLGQAARIPKGLRCCLGRRMGLLRAKAERIFPATLLYCYLSPIFQNTIRARTIHGSTVDRIPLIEIGGFPVLVPGLNTERRIAPILECLRERIEHNDSQSRTLATLRDALLPRLISGDLRVKDAETFLDRVL